MSQSRSSSLFYPKTSRSKIIATLGPASNQPEVLRKLITAGVDIFRLNFSHGTHAEHSEVVRRIREVSQDLGHEVGILQDLCGPKFRLGPIQDDLINCTIGDVFWIVTQPTGLTPRELTCTYTNLPNELKIGESVLFADGTVAMQVTALQPGRAEMVVTLPGRLRSRQGINLPGTELKVDALTPEDILDLEWTAAHADDIQFVGLSFVRSPEDVIQLRKELRNRNCKARIVVKIEKPQAVQRLDEIIGLADAVMVARGDLGVELDVHRVPSIQKKIIALSNAMNRPVITATQMLNSMEQSSRPTRAEASDVFNAVLDGTDAVMLSGESAIGIYPVETVEMMRKICEEADQYCEHNRDLKVGLHAAPLHNLVEPITKAMVDAACVAADELNAPLIVAMSATGRTALAISNRRPDTTILAVTPHLETARSLNICWGVTSYVDESCANNPNSIDEAIQWAKDRNLVRSGQYVVIVRGGIPGEAPQRTVYIRHVL